LLTPDKFGWTMHLLKSDIIKMLIKREFAWNDLSASTQ